MQSTVRKRSIVIDGQKTSISVEEPFWQALKDLVRERGSNLSTLVASIKSNRAEKSNLSSAIRVHILAHLRDRLAALGQAREAPRHAAAAGQVFDQRMRTP